MSKQAEKSSKAFSWIKPSSRPGFLGAGIIHNKSEVAASRGRQFYSALYILEGGGLYQDDANGEIRVAKGNVLILFPKRAYSYRKLDFPVWSECYLSFQGDLIKQLEKDGLLKRTRPVLFPGKVPSLKSAFENLANDYLKKRYRSHSLAIARINALLAEATYYHEQKDGDMILDFVQKSCAKLEEDLCGEIDLAALARSFGISVVHFRKLFTKNVGLSPVQYRIRRKIELAKSLLIGDKLLKNKSPVKEVAQKLGYRNLHFFYRQFKQITGHSPQSLLVAP